MLALLLASGVVSAATVTSRVNQSSDDAEERLNTNAVNLTSPDLELINWDGVDQKVGMRFQNITVPPGATITNAYLEFTNSPSSPPESGATTLVFIAHDTDSAPTFTTTIGNVTSRPETTASVTWNIAGGTTWGADGDTHQTPDLSSVIQEIVDRAGWSSGNSIAILVRGSGERSAYSWNTSTADAPLLVIQYATANLSGTVFEDVNYGGGAGRSQAASSGVGRSNARVELYDSGGAYVTFTTSGAGGAYAFASLLTGSYTVRVVNSTVSSSRPGYVAGLLPVQTYRTDASSGSAVGVINHVGGQNPSVADAANGAAGCVMNTTTGVFTTGTCSGTAQSITNVTLSADVSGVDFGFNFDTMVNVNNTGQGSLRQLLTNANTLGGDASLAQAGRTAGVENAVFMISNGTAVAGLRATNNYFVGGVATVAPASSLPTVTQPLVLDSQTQPGWTLAPIVELNGAGAGVGVNGIQISAAATTVRGFVVNRFSANGIQISGASAVIAGNWLGLDATGTLDRGNGVDGVTIGANDATIGGAGAADRNVVSGNDDEGVDVDPGITGVTIKGNYIGTNASGTAAVGNGSGGPSQGGILAEGIGTRIGGKLANEWNLVSGNLNDGIYLTGTGNVIESNRIGTDATGTTPLANQGPGILVTTGFGASDNTIGGTTEDAGNTIAYNTGDGVSLASGVGTANRIGANAIHSNGGLGIDLVNDGVTVNDGVKTGGSPNLLMDHPVFTLATLSGTTLTVTGYVGSAPGQSTFGGTRVEVFESDGDTSGFGEGRTYLGFLTTAAGGNLWGTLDVSGKGLALGDRITGTATDTNGNTSEFGATFEVAVATAVELLSFVARAGDSSVLLEWETASETRNLGLHLYRSTSAAGPWERITSSLIPGLGSSPEGARYTYRDLGLENGVTYHFLLEDVETTGAAKRHGPVSATPQSGLEEDGDNGEDGADEVHEDGSGESRAVLSFGDPEATSLEVREIGRGGLIVELETGGFYAAPDEEDPGSVRLSVPGFDGLPEAGLPAIPSRLAWVPALVGRQVRIVSVRPGDVVAFDLRPADATAPGLVVAEDGTIEASRRRVKRRRHGADALFPTEGAVLLEAAFQGEDKKALLELSPLRWDPSSGQLLLARRLTVRLVFGGREKGEIARGDFRGRRPRSGKPVPEALLAHLATGAPGVHAVAFESVFPGGGRAVRAGDLALTHLGEPVAFRLVPDPGRFGPGSRLLFWSDGAATNPDANEVVFELSRGSGGRVMASREATPSGPAVTEILASARFESNARYQPALVEAPDPWLWDYVISPGRKGFAFELPGVRDVSPTPARLSVQLQGVTDFPGDPDHHVRLYVNGVPVAEALWDGRAPHTVNAEVAASVLVPAGNSLEIHDVGDTEAAYSLVYLDRFALEYPQSLVAEAGVVQGRALLGGTAVVSGLEGGGAPVLLDTTGAEPAWLTGAMVSGDALAFCAEAGHRYAATAGAAVRGVAVRFPAETTLRDPENAADWVVIVPRAFAAAAETLELHRESQGLEAKTVFVEEIFEHFGYGETHPEAIRDFLGFAFHGWAKAPRLVLLLGDTTYDPKDFYGTGVGSQIPSPTLATSFLWTVSDPLLAAVNGEDSLPDLALGRLPASTPEEAQALVDKLIAWETAGFTLDGPAVLVSDNPDRGGDFDADAAEIASTVLASRPTQQIRLSALGRTGTRSAIFGAFDAGAALVSYLGHGAASVWASEGLLNNKDLDALAPQTQEPFVLTFNCLNGYFTMPKMDSLAEALLKAEGKGAIAAFSPTSMSVNDAAHVYHRALLSEIVSGRHPRLGDAVLAAQKAYADSGAFPELLGAYHLFGDPGTTIR